MGQVCRAVGVCLTVLGFLALQSSSTGAASGVRVDEAACRIDWRNGACVLSLAIENRSGKPIPARIAIDILDPGNKSETSATKVVELPPGRRNVAIPLDWLDPDYSNEIVWKRLRYRIETEAESHSAEGIIGLSEITPDLFDLKVTTPDVVPLVGRLRVEVAALHPVKKRAVAGVVVTGTVRFETEEMREVKRRLSAVTDKEGRAALDFGSVVEIGGGLVRIAQTVHKRVGRR